MQLVEVLNLDVKAFAVPRAGWAEAFDQFGVPKGHTGPAAEMFEAVNAGWMDLGVEGTEHVAGTTAARDVFELWSPGNHAIVELSIERASDMERRESFFSVLCAPVDATRRLIEIANTILA